MAFIAPQGRYFPVANLQGLQLGAGMDYRPVLILEAALQQHVVEVVVFIAEARGPLGSLQAAGLLPSA
ncbi:Uncharacterised protein [Raoultella terrigena]|uniref:Uncharacterized protein n=1 Tax=Raoultella terrigena TaxID=577 RepID=A0A4U9D7N9_RAOTE|nr:Uncharacterised protein [Raoultella terrigena]